MHSRQLRRYPAAFASVKKPSQEEVGTEECSEAMLQDTKGQGTFLAVPVGVPCRAAWRHGGDG